MPSGSQRKRSRTFKARRALMACQRCRHLKKSCQQTDGERCARCTQSDQSCVYVPVPKDPLARAGPSSVVPVPKPPIMSPTEPPFVLHQDPTSDQPDGMHSIPHATRGDYHSFRPMQHFNSQSGLSTSEIYAQAPPIHAPDIFSEIAFDPTLHHIFGNGVYDDHDTQTQSPETPPPFMQNHSRTVQDVMDPAQPHHYLRPFSNPSPLSQNNIAAFTSANSMLSSLDIHDTTFPAFSSTDFASTSNYSNQHLLSDMSTPSQPFASTYENPDLSSYLPCSVCIAGSGYCTLHSPEFNYRCESPIEDEVEMD